MGSRCATMVVVGRCMLDVADGQMLVAAALVATPFTANTAVTAATVPNFANA